MRKTVICALLLCLLLSGCSFSPPAATPEERAQELMNKGAADAAGDPAAALESYRAAEALTPENIGAVRAQIEILVKLAEQGGDYPQQLIAAYESLYAADAFTQEDYMVLARLYLSAGEERQARDLLERGQCLSPSPEKAELLDTIAVELSADSDRVQSALAPLLERLAAGDRDGAADCLMADGLYDILKSRVPGGSRRYRGAAGDVSFRLEAAPDEDGQPMLRLWRFDAAGEVAAFHFVPGELFITEAAVKDGVYEGAFSTERYDALSNSILMDSGTLQGGIAVGAVATELYNGEEETELAQLWAGRAEQEREVYTGELDEAGHALAEQPSGLEAGSIVYAYDEGERNYIYMTAGQEDTAESFVFTAESFGLETPPE